MKPVSFIFSLVVLIIINCSNVYGQLIPSSEPQDENYIVKFSREALSLENSIIYEEPINLNIGIGTTAPVQKLDVLGNISLEDQLYFKDTGSIYFGTSNPPEGRFDFHGKDYSGPYITMMSLLNDGSKGYVGISTPDPEYTLHVKGEMLIETPGSYGAPVIYASPLGLIGIGCIDPQEKLHVIGKYINRWLHNADKCSRWKAFGL